MSFPSNGDPASTIAQMSEAYGLVVAGGAAYFTASFPVGAADPQGKQQSAPGLFSVPLSGAGDPTLVIGSFVNIDGAVSDGVAIFLDGGAGAIARVSIADRVRTDLPLPHGISIDALAVHAGVLYVAAQDLASTSASNGVILSLAATGGTARALVTDIGHPWSLVADASGLTWVQEPPIGQFSDSLIVHAGLDGKGGKTLLSHGANSLAVSNGDLYLAWDGISKVPLGGGAETSLVSGLQGPGRLVVSNGNAAWVDPEFQARSATTVPALMTTCW
jgi:hypothetical protein